MKSLSLTLETAKEDDKPAPTVKESTQKLFSDVRHTLDSLNSIWDAVELDNNSRQPRVAFAFGHISALLEEIVNAENTLVHIVEQDITSRRNEIRKFRKLLGMGAFEEGGYSEGSVPLLRALEKEVKSLISQKEKRMRRQAELYASLQKLCRRADTNDDQLFDDINEKIYSEEELSNIRRSHSNLCDTIVKRQETVSKLQAESKKICETIGEAFVLPDADQELLNSDFSSPAVVLSEEVVERCEMINKRLKEEHDNWMETIAERYDELLAKTNELSKKCCRGDIPRPSLAIQSAKNIQKLEENYQHLQEKYERGGPVFDKLNEWLALWQERLNGEQRACRTSFYNTRGDSLNTTLKRQKYLQTHIPHVFNELIAESEKFAAAHDVEEILVDGFRPDKYAAAIIEEYERDKELNRVQKQLERRGVHKTPTKTPLNTPSIQKTPSTTSVQRKRSISCSKLPASNTPSRSQMNVQKTSESPPKFSVSKPKAPTTPKHKAPATPKKTPGRK